MAEITIFGALVKAASAEKSLSAVPMLNAGWKIISEPFAGAW